MIPASIGRENCDVGSSWQINAVCGDSELLEPRALTNIGCGCQIGRVGPKIGRGCLFSANEALKNGSPLEAKREEKMRTMQLQTAQAATADRNRKWLSNQPCGPKKTRIPCLT